MERNFWAYDACAGEVCTEDGFTLAIFQGWGVESEVLLEKVQLNFSFLNKFIIHNYDDNCTSRDFQFGT
jgi:hypothetical protein